MVAEDCNTLIGPRWSSQRFIDEFVCAGKWHTHRLLALYENDLGLSKIRGTAFSDGTVGGGWLCQHSI